MQRHDVASTLSRRCTNVMCPLGSLMHIQRQSICLVIVTICPKLQTGKFYYLLMCVTGVGWSANDVHWLDTVLCALFVEADLSKYLEQIRMNKVPVCYVFYIPKACLGNIAKRIYSLCYSKWVHRLIWVYVYSILYLESYLLTIIIIQVTLKRSVYYK